MVFILATFLTSCSSKPFDPRASYYENYCYYDASWTDVDTAAYWAQLCELSKKGAKR